MHDDGTSGWHGSIAGTRAFGSCASRRTERIGGGPVVTGSEPVDGQPLAGGGAGETVGDCCEHFREAVIGVWCLSFYCI